MNPPSDPGYVLACAIVFLILCPIIALLRFQARMADRKKTPLGIDDWLIVPATVSNSSEHSREVRLTLLKLFVVGCAIVLIVGT